MQFGLSFTPRLEPGGKALLIIQGTVSTVLVWPIELRSGKPLKTVRCFGSRVDTGLRPRVRGQENQTAPVPDSLVSALPHVIKCKSPGSIEFSSEHSVSPGKRFLALPLSPPADPGKRALILGRID